MRIGELAKRSGIGRDAIRFYERNGLLHSSSSNSGTNTYKDYSENSLDRLSMIREAQDAGFTIADLAQLINSIEQGPTDSFDAEDFLQQKINEVEVRIVQAKRFLETLKMTKRALSEPKKMGFCSPDNIAPNKVSKKR